MSKASNVSPAQAADSVGRMGGENRKLGRGTSRETESGEGSCFGQAGSKALWPRKLLLSHASQRFLAHDLGIPSNFLGPDVTLQVELSLDILILTHYKVARVG